MALIVFDQGFHGYYEAGGQIIEIGETDVQPYDMTYGAIGSCLYATFLEICEERGLKIKEAEIEVNGRKRSEVPTIVTHLNIRLNVHSLEKDEDLQACFEKALECCSMAATFRMVAEFETQFQVNRPFKGHCYEEAECES